VVKRGKDREWVGGSQGVRESKSRVRERRGETRGKELTALIAELNEGERNSKREFNVEREKNLGNTGSSVVGDL
jgi:hypothetical protein